MVLTPSSARQLLCAKATEDSLWCTPQFCRHLRVTEAVNSGPPSDASSSGAPNVVKVFFRSLTRPLAPSVAFSTMGQLEYLSTRTRYELPL